MSDLISRQAAIDALEEQLDYLQMLNKDENPKAESKWYGVNWARNTIADLPSAEPTLYGYNIDLLAYIARVMEKEGVTAEYAARTFDDMSRVIKMIIEEAQQKVEEALNERSNQ